MRGFRAARCGTALAGASSSTADNAERVGAVGEIGRQLVQKRLGQKTSVAANRRGSPLGMAALQVGLAPGQEPVPVREIGR